MDTEHSPRRPSNDENIPNNIMKDAAEADDNNLHRQERKHLLITETTGNTTIFILLRKYIKNRLRF